MDAGGEIVEVVFATDRRLVMAAAAAGRSVLDAAARPDRIRLHMLGGGLSDADRAALRSSWQAAPAPYAIEFHDFNVGSVGDLLRSKTVSHMCYARLFLADFLPATSRRAIYLDVDTVADRDVGELDALPLEGAILAAVPNGTLDDQQKQLQRLGVSARGYFNGGVMVLDLEAWRAQEVGRRAIAFARAFTGVLSLWDQDALNAVVPDQWRPLGDEWNSWAAHTDVPDGRLLHYAMTPKPWDADYRGRHRDVFFRALDRTAFAGWRPPHLFGLGPLATALRRRIPYPPTVLRMLREALGGRATRA